MSLTQKQQRAIEEIIDTLSYAEESGDPMYWIGNAKRAAIDLIPVGQRGLDPKPYKHHAYPDRSSAPLSDYMFKPRPQYEQRGIRYPQQLAKMQAGPTITVKDRD